LKALLAPLEELVALGVALELLLGVDRRSASAEPKRVDLHRVVDDEVARARAG
jgi:hypothetical protein